MKDIEVILLNLEGVLNAEKMMLTGATLTQKGHEIQSGWDLKAVYNRPIDRERVDRLAELPHPALQKLGAVDVAIIGLSRRALAQITRHQNEVKFIAGSLQYSDYSGVQSFVMPPGLTAEQEAFLTLSYDEAARTYDDMIAMGADRDAAGYAMPQGFRTSLLMSATPYQFKHMIRLRTCRRNTPEVRYIFLKLYMILTTVAPELFRDAVPPCVYGKCPEGRMSCGQPFTTASREVEELEK